MQLCSLCLRLGYCRKLTSFLVSDAELSNPNFVADLRRYTASLDIDPGEWHDALTDKYRDYPGRIIGPDGQEVMLDMEQFELPHIREWFRDYVCNPCPPGKTPRLRRENKERVRILATIMRAVAPMEALTWGAANDNEPQR